jgi:hypothetical protein
MMTKLQKKIYFSGIRDRALATAWKMGVSKQQFRYIDPSAPHKIYGVEKNGACLIWCDHPRILSLNSEMMATLRAFEVQVVYTA